MAHESAFYEQIFGTIFFLVKSNPIYVDSPSSQKVSQGFTCSQLTNINDIP